MSDRAQTKRALVDAGAAEAAAGGAQGTVVQSTTNGVAQPNTQSGAVQEATTFGTTTGAGTVVNHDVTIPPNHNANIVVTIVGRNTIAGGTAVAGDEFTYFGAVGAKNVAGTVSLGANAAGTPFTSHTTSLVGVTVGTDVTAPNRYRFVITDVTGEGTIDWVVKTQTTLN
jgi:hypothetical protein